MNRPIDQPTLLNILNTGSLKGNTRTYKKFLGDMGGVYRDEAHYQQQVADRGVDSLVYGVEEQSYGHHEGALIIGTSTLNPGKYGDEFAVTRGHLHAVSNRAELYYGLSGKGVMLLETIDGQSKSIEITPGQAVNVPGEWIHRSVNVGEEPFVTLFCYAADAGQDYTIIADAGGMKNLIVSDGASAWSTIANPDHTGYRTVSE